MSDERLPARRATTAPLPAATARGAVTAPLPTIIKPRKRRKPFIPGPRIVKLNANARRRIGRLVGICALVVTVATLITLAPLVSFARSISPWEAQQQSAYIPTATPSHPYASGEHSFVCAALPFARLAQQAITAGPNAQAHPWYISVILAQWGIEQGWMMPGYTGYNYGNVSAIPGQPTVPGIHVVGSPTYFAYAPSAEQGAKDYVIFIKNGLYNSVAAAYPYGPEAQALALGRSPWDAAHYTATGQPGSTLLSVMRVYNLKRFDQPDASC